MTSAGEGERGERERALAAAIGRFGLWDAGFAYSPVSRALSAAREVESAGYGAIWLHEAGRDAFVGAALLLGATQQLAVGTSIVSIWRHEPFEMTTSARTLGEAFPGRFVLGIGPSHQGARSWHGRAYARPLADIPEYLDAMDQAPWGLARPDPPVPRVLAALGPRMLEVARRRSRGVIPYFVPVAHTRFAREVLGRDPVIAVEQAFVLGEPRSRALEIARGHVDSYLPWPNYRNNLLRLGYAEQDVTAPAGEKLVEDLVAIGDADEVAARVHAHLDAGADHVCLHPLGVPLDDVPVDRLSELAASV